MLNLRELGNEIKCFASFLFEQSRDINNSNHHNFLFILANADLSISFFEVEVLDQVGVVLRAV